jgi:hypothetical protein
MKKVQLKMKKEAMSPEALAFERICLKKEEEEEEEKKIEKIEMKIKSKFTRKFNQK